jgi:hypothetical protein
VDQLADFRQPFHESAEPRSHVAESPLGGFVERGDSRKGGVELPFKVGVKGLGRLDEGFVEISGASLPSFKAFSRAAFCSLLCA